MTAKPKFRLDLIERAHRALDALAEHAPEELTKAQAIQKLIAPIRATQAKGYSLAAIGKVLSESGIPISAGALRLYVGGAKVAARRRKKKAPEKQPTETGRAASTGSLQAAPTPPARPTAGPAGALARNVDLGWDHAPQSNNAALSQTGARRAGFEVRPDEEDI